MTYNFDAGAPADITVGGNNDAMFVASGGNPASGGFAAITYSVNSQTGILVFPDNDPGKVVTGFDFSCDLRVGNSTGDRAADGFSISFARNGDPFLTSLVDTDLAGNCCAETGTKTGIAVAFDTWSGNVFPSDPNDTTDIEGIIVRVDNVTVQKVALPTRHGTADDITSLQTGPRDAAYWANGGDPVDPAAWATLAWRQFAITLTPEAKLTVTWKGNKVLDNYQTTYFPSAGQLVFAARTGGANENTHVDNIHLITTASAVTAVPGAPPNLTVAEVGSRRAKLTWDAAVVAGDPNARVAYEVERNGTVVSALLTTLTYEDRGLTPGTPYTYKVRGKNIAGTAGPDSTTTATTGSDVAGLAFTKNEVWFNIAGTAVDAGTGDPHYSDAPDSVRYGNGFSYGETSGFGNTYGDNFISRMTGLVTVPETGSYRFFIRSDDASALYVKVGSIPNEQAEATVAVESGCCGAFEDVGADGTVPEVTSEPIALTAGQKVGITFLVKEGGGGDWGQVAWRKEGDTTPAASLGPIRGSIIESQVDGVGASISITQAPVDTTTSANSSVSFTAAATGSSPYGADYGNAISWQWYVNNTAVLGANGSTFTIPVVALSQNNAKVKVVAAVAGANATSAEATLTVNADATPPTVTSVTGSASFNSVTIGWSEPVTDPTATDASKYQIAGLTLSAGTRLNDRTVKFTTTTQAENTVYPVVANGVLDNANNPSAFSGSFTSYQFKTGLVTYKTWQGETGAFDTWNGDPAVKDKPPTTSETRTEYVANTADTYDNYFGQLSGYFIPPSSGNYVFYLASDDFGEMYLSTNADPANKKKIGEEPSWGARREWIGNGVDNNSATRGEEGVRSNISSEYQGTEWATGPGGNIALQGGQRYYFEVLFKEGGGGDHGSATYKLASDSTPPANGVSVLTGSVVGTFVDPQTLPPIITQRPTSVSYNEGETVSFSVTVDSASPVTYQWYQNKKAIAGATSATLSIPNAGVGAVGDYYVTATSKNGTASSFPDDDSRAILKGAALVIEAEDYNYDSGKTVAAASTMPLVSDLYVGKDGSPEIDYHSTTVSGGTDDINGNSYRNGWVDGSGTVFPSPAGTGGNLDVIIDNVNGNQTRPDFTLANNYKIGWGGNGNWFQYTRTFAPGKYSAVFGGSRDGRDAAAMGRTLELVTGDITKSDAATTVLGELTTGGTGAWSSNDNIPFLTVGGSTVATFDLAGTQTLRLRISSGDGDNDYILLYKASGPEVPVITGTTLNPDGTITITWTGPGVLQAAPSLLGPFEDVTGATSPYTFTPTAAMLFGRVRN